jgi:hypothetical protein
MLEDVFIGNNNYRTLIRQVISYTGQGFSDMDGRGSLPAFNCKGLNHIFCLGKWSGWYSFSSVNIIFTSVRFNKIHGHGQTKKAAGPTAAF